MALVSVGDEGDAITLSRTNKVTLVSIVTSYSGYNTFLYRQGDDIGIYWWRRGRNNTLFSCKQGDIDIYCHLVLRLKVRSNELKNCYQWSYLLAIISNQSMICYFLVVRYIYVKSKIKKAKNCYLWSYLLAIISNQEVWSVIHKDWFERFIYW